MPQILLEALQARLMLFYALNWGLLSCGLSVWVTMPCALYGAFRLMRVPVVERIILYTLGALVWALVTVAVKCAALLWCAFTLELVEAGKREERAWVIAQSVSLCVVLGCGLVAYVRRPFTLGNLPL
jgi:hypothetical protein